MKLVPPASRRDFLKNTGALGFAATLPSIASAKIRSAKTSQKPMITGTGEYQYRIDHQVVELPSQYSWQTTHNVAVDSENNLYVIHEGRESLKDHPSIFVFDPKGKFIRAFGKQFQGGGHGIEIRKEGSDEFLYVCAYQQVKSFEKLTLQGKTIWKRHAPMESGVYAKGEASDPKKIWGRDRFLPTNFAFLDNGDFFLVDGYGSFYIHQYDSDGKWKRHFGGPGQGEGKYQTPHGIWIDKRKENQEIVICDRAHHTLQFLDLEGRYLRTLKGYGLPANADSYKDLILVPELHARITLLGAENQVVARLGDDVKRVTTESGIRNNSKKWINGKFVHPHDACFDQEGNIFVAEWVQTGRVSKLTRV
ncbi:MAG: 6-bladed beta-propeller [Planctomycetota bacterium]|nr:6-bladed beta-propeller [Planctomycetota bacterium]